MAARPMVTFPFRFSPEAIAEIEAALYFGDDGLPLRRPETKTGFMREACAEKVARRTAAVARQVAKTSKRKAS